MLGLILGIGGIIINVPHSSTYIPKDVSANYVVKSDNLEHEAKVMADLYTDEICGIEGTLQVIAPVSRLVVDTERFTDDEQESMSKIGMGAIYTKTYDLQDLRQKPGSKERKALLTKYYYPHHEKLYRYTKQVYTKFGKALIIDCHSFATKVLPYEQNSKKRPEVCIGIDDYHTDKGLANKLYEILSKKYEVEFNQPFSGTIVPTEYYRKNKNIQSIMIEIRKDNYMDESTFEKNARFNEVKADIQSAIVELSQSFYGKK